MTEIYRKRQQLKKDNIAYRLVARNQNPGIRVAHDAQVQVCEDGAYVEAQIWVKKSDIVANYLMTIEEFQVPKSETKVPEGDVTGTVVEVVQDDDIPF